MKRAALALLFSLTAVVALTVGSATPSRATPAPFTCSYSGKTTIQWHSDRLNKLGVTEVKVIWLDSGDNALSIVDIVYSTPRPGGRLSWQTPAGTLDVSYFVAGTINGSFDPTIFGGFTECSP